ncbi:MAG: AAA family ATPase [Candidatus Eisenbacteria bacterium]|nr:AAA family ATPase [Candidatus Eisenbacteria bacterium]
MPQAGPAPGPDGLRGGRSARTGVVSRVRFESLTLEGFGVHTQATFRFAPGLNTFVCPNETGKSTLLAGILAVLFGLPERSNPEEWGTARFQSWNHPQPFRGVLILQSGEQWHRIQRDFTDHQVVWHHGSAHKLTRPSDSAWKEQFAGEHNPAGRGESVQRYRQALRELIGIDDLDLFRLTFCLAQDIDERTEEEEAFRTREVPRDVQELLSGSGGRVDDVRTRLFDAFAAISMATGDVGLIRPGRKRPRNQQTPGRLDEVDQRLVQARRELREAGAVLEKLQGSQEQLEELRGTREEVQQQLDHDRALLSAWETWLRGRAEQRERHKRIVALGTALRQVEALMTEREQAEQRLAREYPECAAADFDFGQFGEQLDALIDLEQERSRLQRAMTQAHEQIESHQQQQDEAGSAIDARFAPFARNPHILKDFQSWGQVVKEADELRKDLAALDREIRDSESALVRIGRWATLDAETVAEGGQARPLAKLRDLSTRGPRLLEQAAEAQRLAAELRSIQERLEGPLRSIGDLPDEVRREAGAYAERITLLREQAADAERRAREAAERRSEFEARELELEQEYRSLREDFGDRAPAADGDVDADAHHLPPGWITLQAAMREKLGLLQEEGDLLRQASAIPRMVRPSASRQILLPALLAFALVGMAAFTASLFLVPDMPWRIPTAILAGLMAAVATAALTFRRSSAPVLEGLPAALQRLQSVRDAIEEVNRRLGGLRDLDGRDLDALRQRLESFATQRASLARLEGAVPGPEEVARLRSEAQRRSAELDDYESRMVDLGDDPAARIAEWESLTRRREEITRRLADLEREVGPVSWAELPVSELPAVWTDLSRLAAIVTRRVPVGAPLDAHDARAEATAPRETDDETIGRAEPAMRLESAAEVAEILRQAGPGDWDTWISEAQRFEQADGRLATFRSRRATLDEPDEQGHTRLERLEERIAALAASCAPYTLATSLEDLAWTAQEYERQREAREKAGTLGEKATADLSDLESRSHALESTAQEQREALAEMLRPVDGDPQAAQERLRKAGTLRAKVRQTLETEQEVLRSHNAESGNDLQLKREALRDENNLSLQAVREQEDRFPLFREIADAPAERIQQQHAELKRRITERESRTAELDARRQELQRAAAEMQAEGRRADNVAVLELEIRTLERERERLRIERDALRIAFQAVGEAEQRFAGTHRERLAERATEIFGGLTGERQRTITLDRSFAIGVRTADGQACALRQLSQGARDQLALALRLAISELLAETRAIPLLLDDPFLTFDAERLAAMRKALSELAQQRQILLLSHRAEFADWGTPVA